MTKFFLIIFCTGLILFFIDKHITPKPPIIKYRYLPRTIDNHFIDNSTIKDDMFKTMFDGDHVWLPQYSDKTIQSNTI